MRKLALSLIACTALAACSGSGDAGGQAQDGNVEQAADEALRGVDPGAAPASAAPVASDAPSDDASASATEVAAEPAKASASPQVQP